MTEIYLTPSSSYILTHTEVSQVLNKPKKSRSGCDVKQIIILGKFIKRQLEHDLTQNSAPMNRIIGAIRPPSVILVQTLQKAMILQNKLTKEVEDQKRQTSEEVAFQQYLRKAQLQRK